LATARIYLTGRISLEHGSVLVEEPEDCLGEHFFTQQMRAVAGAN
jgi:hypothetical protein